ncbi:uncharacterized protein LOC107608297 [Arachis ipaensis]|uniref:uncharacterized protein LOC107608297 n=1 Tax=Arachis ipaensis TaxID=130454 RepID=UPI000A2B02CD|nr:uncharacterized protein LOC107608297 [Arachis ipaensis]
MPFGSLVTTRKVSTWPPFSLRIKQTVHERILRIYDDFVWPLNLSSLASENKFLAVKLKQAANSIFPESNASSVNDYEVIQETLRSANILSFTFREVVEDVELQDYYIPKGWKVLPLFKAFTILLISSLNHTNSTPHASRYICHIIIYVSVNLIFNVRSIYNKGKNGGFKCHFNQPKMPLCQGNNGGLNRRLTNQKCRFILEITAV